MKALVTGGAGFIGSAISRALIEEGASVCVLDNLSTGNSENIPQQALFVEDDIRDPKAAASACKKADVVFHQAAIRSVPKSVDDPMLSNDSNVTGTLNLLQAATEAQVERLIYASSSSVYGDTGGPDNRENLPTNPESPYAVSKLAAENYCKVWTRLGRVPTISLRYFNVFGPGQPRESKYAAVFPAFLSALTDGNAPEVHWDGEQSRDFTFIDDVVNANLKAAEATPDSFGAAMNIGGGSPKTVNQVLATIAEALGIWIEPVFTPRRAGDVRKTCADIGLAAKLIGWLPHTDWDRAVKATVEGWH